MNFSSRRLLTALTLGLIVGASAEAVEPLRTNGASFRIPFAVDQSNGSSLGTAVLFASKNGAAMEPVQRVAASERSFHFLAPSDGKFQFAVRMMNAQGKLIGEDGPLVPELEVIVDSKPPTVFLELAEIAAGEAVLKWSFSEQDVAADTLKIEYLESSTGVWKPVPEAGRQGAAASNQTSIRSNPGQSIAVRATVKDRAGNLGSGTGQIVLSRQPSRQNQTSAVSHSAGHSHAASNRPASSQGSSSSRNFVPFGSQSATTNQGSSLNIPTGNSQTILGSSPFSLSDEDPKTVAIPKPDSMSRFASTESAPISMQSIRAANSGSLSIPAQTSTTSGSHSGFQAFPDVAVSQQPLARQDIAQQPMAQPLMTDTTPVRGITFNQGYQTATTSEYGYNGLDQQHLNNRLFDLAYEIDSVGPSGVGMVVLYVTEDNGRNWFRYGEDKDLKSPVKIDTRGEGTFGFAVRVHNGVGFSDPPPQPGEVPSVLVTVDQTPPALRMATPELVTQGQGTIRLKWEIQESNPADAAVRLEYSTLPEGPWSPVFDWQQNPSGFEMPVDNSLPPALHFRLLARDQAGNVSTTSTAQPVLIDRKRPKARVLSVKPASATPGY